MNTKIYLPIDPSFKILVCESDVISGKTAIFQFPGLSHKEIIPVAGILHINPSSLPKYFKKQIGESVKLGETLVEKKGLLSHKLIKSPLAGKISEIDLKKGTMTLVGGSLPGGQNYYCPVSGKVKKIDKTQIEIETQAKVYYGTNGFGKEARGILNFYQEDSLGILDISGEIEKGIVVCKMITPEVTAKLEVLGAVGLIGCKVPSEHSLPSIIIADDVLEELSRRHKENIWLRPQEKEMVIYTHLT